MDPAKRERLTAFIVGAIMAMGSTWFVLRNVIIPNVSGRRDFILRIFANTQEPPYQYRILKHLLARGIQVVLHPLLDDLDMEHIWSYGIVVFLAFVGIYVLFYALLRRWFSRSASLLGITMLGAITPLTVTGYVMEGDFLALFFYVLALWLMVRGHHWAVPLVILVATLNREQMIWVAVMHAIFLVAHGGVRGTLRSPSRVMILAADAIAWTIAFLGVRLYFGFKPSAYTPALHLAHNTDPRMLGYYLVPLWIAIVVGFYVLAFLSYRRSNAYLKLSLMSLAVYTTLFFFNGNLWELAKYLPAYLTLIPMALQAVMDERVPDSMMDAPPPG